MDNLLFPISVMCLVILMLIFLLKKLRQPYLIAYIVAGLLLGPQVSHIFTDTTTIAQLGELGVLLLMFFLGMEIDIPDKKNLLFTPVIAQSIKTVISLIFALAIGRLMHWTGGTIVLLTVLFTFNSTAVVSELLRKNGTLHSSTGKVILNMLLLQDVMLAPVLTLFQFMDHQQPTTSSLVPAIAGSALIFLLLRAIRNRTLFQLPILKEMENDHDLQVFTGACICLGFALLASAIGLTGSVGSFAAGIFIGRTHAFHWLEKVLQPFKVFFVALFFVSVGLLIDLRYVKDNYVLILSLTMLVLLSNSLLSALAFRLLGYPWYNSLYAGALLSQTGEFGILACSLAYSMGIIQVDFFKTSLAVTGLSLLCSTIWITIVQKFIPDKKLITQSLIQT